MSGDPKEEAAALASALVDLLEHERRFHGASYVDDRVDDGTADLASESASESASPEAPAEVTPAREAPSRPSEAPIEAPVHSAAAGRPRESVDDVRRRVQRQQANEWTPERKLAYLEERNVGDCRRCRLCERRTQIVFGVGSARAKIMFVGEAPGAEEDRRGEPFVGAAGRRLDQWIEALGLRRADVYIANVIKCRPPGNRDPKPDEIAKCSPFLHAQIRAIEPEVIIALGRFAGAQMLGRDLRLHQMRGAVHDYEEPKSGRRIPVCVTYHPSYVLRREGEVGGRESERDRDGKSENDRVLHDLRSALAAATKR